MRLGRRCSLCGERLDSSLRCTACGLDNTKNDDMYKHLINRNDCEDMPLTHVHEEPKKHTYSRNTSYSNKKSTASPTRKKKTNVVGIVVAIIMLFSTIIPALVTILGNLAFGFHEEAIPEYELTPEEVWEYEYWLSPGFHEVGVHIPAGWCEIALEYGEWVSIGIYELDEEMCFIEKESWLLYSGERGGMELEEGDYLVVETVEDVLNTSVWLYTNSSDFTESVYVDSGDSYSIKGQVTAGVDFPAGVYDIMFAPETEWEYGEVQVVVENPNPGFSSWYMALPFEYMTDYFEFSEDNIYGCYTNIPLTPGTVVTVDEELIGNIYIAPSYEVGQELYDMTWGAATITVE